MLIFLDFDGVLRRQNAPLYRFEKPMLASFEAAIRRLPDARIVVTSSWREVVGLAALRRLFSPDVAERVVGVTPFVEQGRYREILAYLEQTAARGDRWIVVDDDPYGYPDDLPLLLVDPSKGFGAEEAERLVAMARG